MPNGLSSKNGGYLQSEKERINNNRFLKGAALENFVNNNLWQMIGL